MASANYEELNAHIGHSVVVANYATENVAIECEDCSEVLIDFDREVRV